MLTTGLLSLNVHDSLTFEGTELCLNPDIFTVELGQQRTRSANNHVAPNNQNNPNTGTTATNGDDMNNRGIGSASTNSGNSANGSMYSSSTPLSVGDTIEIRVWDPLPKESATKSPSSTNIMRKSIVRLSAQQQQQQQQQPSPPIIPGPSGMIGITNASGTLDATASLQPPRNNNNSHASNNSAPSLRPRTSAYSGLSLQYSESDLDAQTVVTSSSSVGSTNKPMPGTPQQQQQQQPEKTGNSVPYTALTQKESGTYSGTADKISDDPPPLTKGIVIPIPSNNNSPVGSASAGGGGVSVLPNNSATNPVGNSTQQQQPLPPVFPRSRTGTVDAQVTSTPGNKALSKPSMIHRRAVSSASAIPVRSPKQQQKQVQQPSSARHVRDISDVTMDTHQLDFLAAMIQPTDSHDTMFYDDITDTHDASWSRISMTHRLRLSFVLKVTNKTLSCFKGNSRTQISMLRQVADLYNLSTYDLVTVHKIEPQDEEEVLKAVSADFVVVTIKDQFISRGDMLLFQTKLIGSWIYEGQRLTETTRGIKAHAREIRHGNYSAKSGIVTDKTMITFRSRSARIVWLVQLSTEMWDYTSPYEHQYEPESVCEIYFDQWIRFLYKLFTKWKELEVTHSLTVIFFSRTFLANGLKSSLDCQDVYGRSFEDHYKPVIESETCVDWESLIVRIKEEFIKYPLEVGWNLADRRPSSASQGNLLEAINVTLNLMQYHYLDRDLHRTGQSIVIVSPGCGVFEVDKGLAGITYQRMMDNGIGSDMLSLGLPPLHIAPFFLYNNEYRNAETQGIDAGGKYYEVPHWMHLSFVTYDRPEEKRVYLSGLEDKTAPVQTSSWLDAYEIGANGFLRPHLFQQDVSPTSPVLKSQSPKSSFSAVGNKAATPGKAKVVQERGQARQLISGRNFRDILEACRPRVLGASLPSSLESLLSLKEFAIETKTARRNGTDPPSKRVFPHRDVRLKEWGTVDFSELPLHAMGKSSRGNSPSPSLLKMSIVNQSTMKPEKSQSSDDASNASSYGSTPVSSTYGTSFERVFWDYYDSPKTPGLQIQKSPSFELDHRSIEGETNEDSVVASDNASKSSIGGDSDTNQSQKSKVEKQAEYLKKFMDAYNTTVCTAHIQENSIELEEKPQWSESVALGQELEVAITPKSGILTQNIRQTGRESRPSGGLGAALSQYGTLTHEQEQPSSLLKRRSSGGNLLITSQTRTSSFHNERRRAASPMFNTRAQLQDRLERIGSPKMFSSMIPNPPVVDPPELLRTEKMRPLAIHRPLPSRAAASRDGYASTLSMTPSSIYQSNNSINRALHSTSVSQFDNNRQKPPPLSRSPPSSTGGGFSTYSFSSGANTRAPLFTYPQSPPKLGVPRERTGAGIHGQRERSGPSKSGSRDSAHSSAKGSVSSRRKKAFNPFRQSDEDEVLAKRSHNRRRWSHVFPVGEVEFKRHAGPIWNSLTSPAILPLSVDYFPSPQELRDESTFQFNFYQVTLSGIENNHYTTHADLLMEMVRQRVTQDFQIVTEAAVAESERRGVESQREGRNSNRTYRRQDPIPRPLPAITHDASGTTKHYLSMGHRIQVMSYNPNSDTIEIVVYNRKSAQNDRENVYTYKFLLFSKVSQQYTKSIQTFKKYSEPYKWNRVDNLICGEEDRTMDVGMRFRRVMFGLIPEYFKSEAAEEEYVSKFQKLLSYLEKLKDKDASAAKLPVQIVTSGNRKDEIDDDYAATKSRRDMTDDMIRFSVQLVRGKKDPFEWIEIAIDPVFDTSMSYRIMFNWLVASSAKVETQLQLLHRRCTQFGLKLISFPQTTVSWNLYLHALAVPTYICILDKEKAKTVDATLTKLDFVYDGITITSPQFLDCLSETFYFPRYRSGKVKSIPSPQYVHRSGALFIRKMTDRHGKVILAGIENYRHASGENRFREMARQLVSELRDAVQKLNAGDSGDANT